MTKKIGGIEGLLGHLVSKPGPPQKPPANAGGKPSGESGAKAKENAKPERKKSTPNAENLKRAHTGRPAGLKSGESPPKKKTSFWLPVDLMSDYVDWSWEARQNISRLVEEALRDFQRRQRGRQGRA